MPNASSKKQPGPLTSPIYRVNLLVQKGQALKLEVRLMKWILASGRFIVVIVEIIVITAFIYRYKLDTDLADLQERINEQVPYIKSLKNDELALKQVQFQLSTIRQTRSESPDFVDTLNKIASLTPRSIRLTNITFEVAEPPTKAAFTINGQTPSNLELSAFINALKQDPQFSDINLSNISFESQTTFAITGTAIKVPGRKN